jgi:S1-C subfamily serine protease
LISPNVLAKAPPGISVKANELETLTMGDLVVRIDNAGLLGSIDEVFRVAFIEQLRRTGYPALGAEDLVFKRDDSEKARFVIGGTLDELDCEPDGSLTNCRVGVMWKLLDRKKNAITYEVRTRYVERNIPSTDDKSWVKRFLLSVFDTLLVRPKFVQALKKVESSVDTEKASFPAAHFKACDIEPKTMPEGAEQAISGTVLIEGEHGFGSGIILSVDGYALTAAHVVADESKLTAKLRDGSTRSVRVLRVATKRDVALVKLDGEPIQCLTVAPGQAQVGAEVYAIGSPESKDLSFSISRGIVSGMRDWNGDPLIQTDASVNSGHSGGPLIDGNGRIIAITLSKIAGIGIEGVAFGAPIENALEVLGVSSGNSSDAIEPYIVPPPLKPTIVTDTPDPIEPIASKSSSSGNTQSNPAYVKALLWGGIGLASVGTSLVVGSWTAYNDSSTYTQFKQLRLANDVGWTMFGLGAASITTSIYLITRQSPNTNRKTANSQRTAYEFAVVVGPGTAHARLDF